MYWGFKLGISGHAWPETNKKTTSIDSVSFWDYKFLATWKKLEKTNKYISRKAVNRCGDRRTEVSQDLHATQGSNKTKNKKIKISGSIVGFSEVLRNWHLHVQS